MKYNGGSFHYSQYFWNLMLLTLNSCSLFCELVVRKPSILARMCTYNYPTLFFMSYMLMGNVYVITFK